MNKLKMELKAKEEDLLVNRLNDDKITALNTQKINLLEKECEQWKERYNSQNKELSENKLSNEKEKNLFLTEKIKNFEKMKYNNPRYGEENYHHKSNINQRYMKNNMSKKSTIDEEDEDCDIMSEYSLNEFIYILTKCFESKQIDLTTIESKIFTNEVFNLFNSKENYRNFILKIASNLCMLLNM